MLTRYSVVTVNGKEKVEVVNSMEVNETFVV